jgi:hypothetical protein
MPAAKTEDDIDALLPWRIELSDLQIDAARTPSP